MDEKFFLYGEEYDWQLRARKSGWNLRVCKDAIIVHGDSVSTKGSGRSGLFYYYHNRAAILLNTKWKGKLFAYISMPLVAVSAIYQAKSLKNIIFAFKGIIDGCFGIGGKYIKHK